MPGLVARCTARAVNLPILILSFPFLGPPLNPH
jgi:hypothetical protein